MVVRRFEPIIVKENKSLESGVMSKKPTGKFGSRDPQTKHKKRSNYVDPSQQFVQWINRFEFEKTWFGRIASRLEERFRIRRICVLFLFCITLSYLLFYDFDFFYQQKIGDVAASDFKSPVSFEVVDHVATEEKRTAAEKAIPPVFDLDLEVFDRISGNVFKAFQQMREDLVFSRNKKTKIEEHEKKFEEVLGHQVSSRLFNWLKEKKFSARLEHLVVLSLDSLATQKVANSLGKVLSPNDKKVVVRVVEKGVSGGESTVPVESILDLSKRSQFSLDSVLKDEKLSNRDRRNIQRFVFSTLEPNLTLNKKETGTRKANAREAVLPVVIAVKKNQIIISKGTLIQPIHITLLNEIQKLKASRRTGFISFVSAILLVSLVLVFFSYLRRFSLMKAKVESKDLAVMGIVTIVVVLLTKLFWFMTNAAFASKLGWLVPENFFLYMAPVTLGAMLVGLLITTGEVVWLFTVFLATALGLMVEDKFPFLLVTAVGGIAAARGVHGCKKRNDIYWAGLRTGLVNALMITAVFSVAPGSLEPTPGALGWLALAGFLSGVLSSAFAMMLVPILETAFNYTTDVKLLELSNLNHPLLKEMIVKAPGTYHHSLVVGSMCDAAAEAIGANPLLAKVMAYYHDIGKTEHAAYFIENQKPGQNPHDHLSPHMSKTILIAHVKDGAELGMKYKLGKPIIDGILQHHGTTLISYFYNKALEEQDEDIDLVSEDEFRYPGPKPQFKEAALCMLADSIEAAARSLDEPTTARLQNIVRNIIQRKFMEGQLDECNLTLRDLSTIEDAFERILLGIYHQRVDYPKASGGGASEAAPISFAKKSKKDTATG